MIKLDTCNTFPKHISGNLSSQHSNFRLIKGNGISKDCFVKSNISFQADKGPSKATLDYIQKRRAELKAEGKELSSLTQLDVDKIKDICKDIDVFKGWTSKDLAFASNNMEGISLQRGCVHQCSHCSACSPDKLTTMNWDNYVELIDGMKQLKDRLGFNPLSATFPTKYREYKDVLQPFYDSDPMLYKSKDKNGVVHNIYDAAKEIKDKTGTKFYLTTAGWNPNDYEINKAADAISKDPHVIDYFNVSLTPFHRFMEKSYQCESNRDYQGADMWRNKYINMMLNAIQKFYPLLSEKGAGAIMFEYQDKDEPKRYSKQAEQELFNELHRSINNALIYYSDIPIQYYGKARELQPEYIAAKYTYETILKQYLSDHPEKNEIDFLNTLKTKQPDVYKSIEKFHLSKALSTLYFNELQINEIYDSNKFIDVDGTIVLKFGKHCVINENGLARTPLKLNFSTPTKWTQEPEYAYIDEKRFEKSKRFAEWKYQ